MQETDIRALGMDVARARSSGVIDCEGLTTTPLPYTATRMLGMACSLLFTKGMMLGMECSLLFTEGTGVEAKRLQSPTLLSLKK